MHWSEEFRNYWASASLSHELTVDSVNSNAAHLRARSRKINVVDLAVIAPHVDTRGSAVRAGTFLHPNVERRQSEIFSIHGEVEFLVFGVRDLAVEIRLDVRRRNGRRRWFRLNRRRRDWL